MAKNITGYKLYIGDTTTLSIPREGDIQPSVKIYNQFGNLIFQGAATIKDYRWEIDVYIDKHEIPTGENEYYKVVWRTNEKQFYYLRAYYPTQVIDARGYVGLKGRPVRVYLMLDFKPAIDPTLTLGNNNYSIPSSNYVMKGDYYEYMWELNVNEKETVLVFEAQEDLHNPIHITEKMLYMMDINDYKIIAKMMEGVDKIQKVFGYNLEYSPYHYYTFLLRGLGRLNTIPQATNWNFYNVPAPVQHLWLMCAELELLEAQFLAEADTSFNFSGQSVSLDLDITGMIESAISHRKDWIQENGTKDKNLSTIRSQVAVVGLDRTYGGGRNTRFDPLNRYKK